MKLRELCFEVGVDTNVLSSAIMRVVNRQPLLVSSEKQQDAIAWEVLDVRLEKVYPGEWRKLCS